MRLTKIQLRCLTFLRDHGADGTGRAEWELEYAADLPDAAPRVAFWNADRVVQALVRRGLVDRSDWGVTEAGERELVARKRASEHGR